MLNQLSEFQLHFCKYIVASTIAAFNPPSKQGDTGTGMVFNAQCYAPSAYRKVSSTKTSPALDYIRFANIEEFTVIGTSKNDSIKTDAGNDIINAGAGNDTITGGAGGDTLTGGTGVNTFNYTRSTDSLLANYDVITDLKIGSDLIDGPRAVSALQLKELGNVAALTEIAIQQVLTATNFLARGAATFSFGDSTFLGINDRTAGFSASTDSIIEITGFTGNLTDLAIV
ncbi:MAG: bluetail domain-containing putative surface protein [Coleofasciculaceae cyanobacterium]